MKTIKTIIALLLCAVSLGASAQKYVGGDISLLTKYEDSSAKYYDTDGNEITDLLTFFKTNGMNAMRVRLFVNPDNASTTEKNEGVCQDLTYVIALGKRIKAAGFKFMLDFHYSDTWADPTDQWIPADWASLSNADLYTKIYDYTKDALQQFVAADATPDFIQTGNEISYGMMWGTSSTATASLKKCYSNSTANWDYFTTLLGNATKACREVCPDAKIIMHTELIRKPDILRNFYDNMKTYGVDYDIIGLSYYPYYHGTLPTMSSVLTTVENRYSDKNIMIVETGYYHKWQPDGLDYDISSTYPISEDGQKAFTDALIDTLNNHKKVTGLFWWDMEANEYYNPWTSAVTPSGWYNAGLFDNETGKVESALYELKKFAETTAGINNIATPANKSNDDVYYNLSGTKTSSVPTRKGIYIHQGKKIIIK